MKNQGTRLLFHVCCAPCSLVCVEALCGEGFECELYWYNPNIHPFTEYKKRRDTLIQYGRDRRLNLVVDDVYGLRDFISKVLCNVPPAAGPEKPAEQDVFAFPGRCVSCYRVRLEKTAQTARQRGFDAFSTSLLVSPYQDHECLKKTGEEASRTYGIPFLYRDFRPFFRTGQQEARRAGLYLQKYCGCVFSEEERYAETSAL